LAGAPAGGAYSAPTDPLAGFEGPTSKGDGRERKGGKEKERKEQGEGREKEGKESGGRRGKGKGKEGRTGGVQ